MIKAASLFSQILSTIRTAANFDNLVAKHEAILRMGGVLLFVNLPSDDAATEDVHDGFRQNVFCKREILKVAKIFPQQGGGEFCHPSLRIRESLTRLLGPSNSSR